MPSPTSLMISKKTKSAVNAAALIAARGRDHPVTTHDISERLGLSISYTERIVSSLKSHGLVRSFLGPGGGYQIAGDLSKITVWDVVKLFERPIPGSQSDLEEKQKAPMAYELLMHDFLQKYLSSQTLAEVDHSSPKGAEAEARDSSVARSNPRVTAALAKFRTRSFSGTNLHQAGKARHED
jgi:Rrf2 family transcriptional regulator, iron-sulfur cluster assembly transcription factor